MLPPVGKQYMCFQKYGEAAQASRCIKSRIMTKVVDYVLSIDTFEQKKLCLNVCCNHRDWNITYIPLTLNYPEATMLYMNTNVFKTPKHYTNNMVSVTTSNNSKIFLRLLWFLLLKGSPTTFLYIPWYQHQLRKQMLKNTVSVY